MRIPSATYRIQLRDGLTLDGVVSEGWLDHAHRLGASHLYLSPVLGAVPGSSHGYDVVDTDAVDDALGGDDALERLAAAARERGMGLVIDIVPNHMAADHTSNRWWWDVLRNGDTSVHRGVFDLDLAPPEHRLAGRIFLPVLEDHYGRVLESGRITLSRTDGELVVLVDERPFPLEPSTLASLLAPVADRLDDDLLRLVASSYRRVERADATLRAAELRVLDGQLIGQLRRPPVAALVDLELERVSNDHEQLHDLLERQCYRLAHWRAARDLGYRRFFDVSDLIGVRVEDPDVFDATHRAVRRWIERDLVDGLRIDHPDGLADPTGYLERLQSLAPQTWIVVEKILEHGEELPGRWPVQGSTGYDVAELLGRWILDPDGLGELGALRDERMGAGPGGDRMVEEAKRDVLHELLAAELNRVTEGLLRVCESLRRFRDVTRHELHELLREVAVAYPVYRSYVAPGELADDRDMGTIGATLAAVRRDRPELDGEVVDLVESLLCGRLDDVVPAVAEVRTRIQQLTGPAMAKGKEDTAFYREVRLVSRNEVGADPFAGSMDAAGVHQVLQRLHRTHPSTMTSLSTHDSKRSEDVRARLAVLTGALPAWRRFLAVWDRRADALDPDGAVDPLTRAWLCQTYVGAAPLSAERLCTHARKAVREAKLRTSWLRPDERYEDAVVAFAAAVADDDELRRALDVLDSEGVRGHDRTVSLVQKVLQLTAVGVPDLYWGSEDLLLRLVDPDNRSAPLRPVLAGQTTPCDDPADPLAKLHAVQQLLHLRGRRPDCFDERSGYRPLEVRGPDAERLLAFARGDDVAVVASRWPWRGPLHGSTSVELPAGGPWRRVIGTAESLEPIPQRAIPVVELLAGWGAMVVERAVVREDAP